MFRIKFCNQHTYLKKPDNHKAYKFRNYGVIYFMYFSTHTSNKCNELNTRKKITNNE